MPGPLNPVVLRITLRATLGRKRALVFLLVPAVLLLITVTLKLVAKSPVWPAEFLGVFGFSVVLPLTALIIGTSVLGAEIDDGSIVHLLATPVSRVTVVLSKFAAAVLLTVLFGAIPEYVAAGVARGFGGKLALGLLAGALVASVAYNALFVMLSVLTTRAIAVGLLYLLVWEGLLGNLVGGVRVLSIGQYSVSVANSITRTSALNAHLTTGTAIVMAAVVTAATLAIAARLASPRSASRATRSELLAPGRTGRAGPGARPPEQAWPPGGRAARWPRRQEAGPPGQRGVPGPGRKLGPCPGTISVAISRMRCRLLASAAWSGLKGSSAGPSCVHQACVHTTTPSGVYATVLMSCSVWPGVASSRIDGLSSNPSASLDTHRSPS